LAPPLGELSPKVTERVSAYYFPSPSSLRSATSPKGRGKPQESGIENPLWNFPQGVSKMCKTYTIAQVMIAIL